MVRLPRMRPYRLIGDGKRIIYPSLFRDQEKLTVRQSRPHRLHQQLPMTLSPMTPSPAYPGVEQRIDEIDDEVHDRDDEPQQQNSADDDRVVASGDALHEVSADSRHLIDRLDEKRSGGDIRQNDPGNRDDREQRIAHPVTR